MTAPKDREELQAVLMNAIAGCCFNDLAVVVAAERALLALDEAGVAIVPREPSEAMCDAWNSAGSMDHEERRVAQNYPDEYDFGPDWVRRYATKDWHAMVAASPYAPKGDQA